MPNDKIEKSVDCNTTNEKAHEFCDFETTENDPDTQKATCIHCGKTIKRIRCITCDGTGKLTEPEKITCPNCNGNLMPLGLDVPICSNCINGEITNPKAGKEFDCYTCHGSGWRVINE